MLETSREQVVAFRAAALNLTERLPPNRIPEAARPCGLQDTPPGNAAAGAAARIDGLTPEAWEHALEIEKTVVQLYAMRGSPFVVATDDLPLFTLGLSPSSERTALHLITSGLRPVVEESGVPVLELVRRLADRTSEALDGHILPRREFARELAAAVPEPLRGEFADEERMSVLTLTVARIVAHEGRFLIAPRVGKSMMLVRTDQWLGRDALDVEPDEARAELVRRFLRAFGPATASDLAWWAAVHPDVETQRALEEHADRLWKLVERELEQVTRPDGSPGYVLAADAARLTSPPQLDGVVRLLPPHDPLLMLRDREVLVPEVRQKRIWRAMHNPGIVFADGQVVATWNARKSGRRLDLTVESLESPIAPATREAIREEASRLAPLRECTAVELTFAP